MSTFELHRKKKVIPVWNKILSLNLDNRSTYLNTISKYIQFLKKMVIVNRCDTQFVLGVANIRLRMDVQNLFILLHS